MWANGNSFGVSGLPELSTTKMMPKILDILKGWPNK
jgi:hypothetical protein